MILLRVLLIFMLMTVGAQGNEQNTFEQDLAPIEQGCQKLTITEAGFNMSPKIQFKDLNINLYDLGISNYGLFHFCHHTPQLGELIINQPFAQSAPSILSEVITGELATAEILYSKAIISLNQKDPSGVEQAVQSGRMFLHIGMSERGAEAFTLGAKIAARFTNTKEATKLYHEAAELWSKTENKRMQSIVLNDLGRSLHYLGNFDDEVLQLHQALKIAAELNDEWLMAVIKNNICLNLHDSGALDQVIECYEDVLKVSERLKDHKRMARTMNNIGGYHADLGNSKEALLWFSQAQKSYLIAEDHGGAAIAQSNQANQLITQGKYQEAIQRLHESEKVLSQLASENHRFSRLYLQEAGWAEYLIGTAFSRAGEKRSAKQFLRQAIGKLSDESGKPLNMKNWLAAHLNLFDIYLQNGESQQALKLFTSIENSVMETDQAVFQVKYLLKLTDLYQATQEHVKSLEVAILANDIASTTDSPYLVALTEYALGVAYARKDHKKGLAYLRQANEFIADIDPHRSAIIQVEMAAIELELRHHKNSQSHIDEAVNLIHQLGSYVHDHNLRVSILSTWKKLVDIETSIHLTSTEKPSKTAIKSAYMANSRFNRMPLLIGDENRFQAGTSTSLIQSELQVKLNTRLQLLEEEPDSEFIKLLNNEIDLLNAQMMVSSAAQNTIQFKDSVSQDKRDIQSLVHANETLLRFWFSENKSLLWVISNSEINLYFLPSQTIIKSELQSASDMLANPSSPDIRQILNNIANLLKVQEWSPLIDTERLLIEPNGIIENFPLEILPLNIGKDQLLLDRYYISYHRSIYLRSPEHNEEIKLNHVSVFADPVSGLLDERISNSFNENRQNIIPDAAVNFSRLRGSRQEALTIQKIIGNNVAVFLGFEATRPTFLNQVERAGVIHVASHTYQDPENPVTSGIILSRFDDQGRPIDGTINFNGIIGRNIEADLVVLSACETAVGITQGIQGTFGLKRAFLEAGASQVISTSWPINDRLTQQLMEKFYHHLIHTTQAPALALTLAKREVKSIKRYSHPHHWSGFMVSQ